MGIIHDVNQNLKDWERYSLLGYIDQSFEDFENILTSASADREKVFNCAKVLKQIKKFIEVCYVQKTYK